MTNISYHPYRDKGNQFLLSHFEYKYNFDCKDTDVLPKFWSQKYFTIVIILYRAFQNVVSVKIVTENEK